MKKLKEEYKKFLEDIEKNIKNPEDLKYVKERFLTFFDIVLGEIESMMKEKEEKMKDIETKQNSMEDKIAKIQEAMNNIEKDIYSEDGFDFEIVCPYCNYEFFIDVDENKTEIECPQCTNVIELDWSGDIDGDEESSSSCGGSCSSCGGCDNTKPEDNDNKDDKEDM